VRLIAVSPGTVTGYVIWAGYIRDRSQLGPDEHHGELWNTLVGEWQKSDVIVFGNVDPSAGPVERELQTEYKGVAKAVADAFSIRICIQSTIALDWASNTKLRRWGARHESWPVEKRIVDAEKHALYYLVHNAYVSTEVRQETNERIRPVRPEEAKT
jgi:hypothetical protein